MEQKHNNLPIGFVCVHQKCPWGKEASCTKCPERVYAPSLAKRLSLLCRVKQVAEDVNLDATHVGPCCGCMDKLVKILLESK